VLNVVSLKKMLSRKELLEYNGYTVVAVPSPPPKAVPVAASKEASPDDPAERGEPSPATPPAPETFTVGVSDITFNPINAIFGRLLHTKNGHVVTQAFWQQQEPVSHDEVPYYEKKS
jgi:hypothetical protein